ncbi:MAG: glycosyltransferase family 2 protein, partial [Actinobacteria bacterium]|nr:glycosyltransferase family 2 protein [Actinomycetota bacterium]
REIIKIAKKDKKVIGIFLSRNFGPESSGQAILDKVKGDVVIMIAGDLQEPPELILSFIKKWEEGYNIVAGIYTKTEDDLFMRFARKNFYRLFKLFTGLDIPTGDSGFGLIDRKALNALNSLPERYRFYRGLRAWVGFKTAYIKYEE